MFSKRHALTVVLFIGVVFGGVALAHPIPGTVVPAGGGPAFPHWFLLIGALVAAMLGGLHGFEPDLAKAIPAHKANRRVTVLHAALVGLILAASYIVGLTAFASLVFYVFHNLISERINLWLRPLCGLVIAAIGGLLLLRWVTGTSTDHDPAAAGAHAHGLSRSSRNRNSSAATTVGNAVNLTQRFTLHHAGNFLPSASALIVLLGAFGLHSVGFGLLLIVASSLGFAVVIICIGVMRADAPLSNLDQPRARMWPPVVTASLMIAFGCVVAYQGFSARGLHFALSLQNPDKARLGPLLYVIGLGLILGMRHSTDADHVVAISTIVGRQKSIRSAAFIGSVWGIGHTITVFIVGSLIILFGVEIPPRLGLSMEFCVALMLVLLGILNLTGVLRKVMERYTPKQSPTAIAAAERVGPATTISEHVLERTTRRFGAFQFLRPLVIGLVHGLAGSAAVALLVLSTIHNPLWATFYLLVFGAGTMVGMMCMTAAMAVPFTYAGERFTRVGRYLNYASGLASLGFGSFLVYQLGYVGNLFGSHPIWTPQ